MSKLKLNNINFDESDFLVDIAGAVVEEKNENELENQEEITPPSYQEEIKVLQEEAQKQAELIINRAKDEAQKLVEKAQNEAKVLVEKAQNEAIIRKEEIIEEAKKRADEIVEIANNNAQKDAQDLIEKANQEIENLKVQIEQERIETTKQGYEDGYKDGQEHIQEELEEKISDFNAFCSNQYEVREKIIKSANKDIMDLIVNISRKVLLRELDENSLEKIIKSTVLLLEKKENINIILSEKYAKLLFELQNKTINDDETELRFEDFKQYENFDVVYNPEFDDDTIIVENLKERYDASINSQLDVIIRNIYDNTQNGKLDLEQYLEDEAE